MYGTTSSNKGSRTQTYKNTGALKRSDSKESVLSRASVKTTSTVKSEKVCRIFALMRCGIFIYFDIVR